MNDILLRIRELITEKNLSDSAFAKRIGLTQSTFSNFFQRDSTPKANIMKNISNEYGVNLNWLITGEGEMFLSKERENEDTFSDNPEQEAIILDYLLGLLVKKGVIADKMSEDTYRTLQRQLAKTQQEAERAQQEAERAQQGAERAQREAERIKKEMKRYEVRYSESDEVSEPEQEYESRERLPLYEVVAAGKPLESFDAGETYSVPLSRLHGNPKQYFAVRVRGESMTEAGIYDNSIVVIRKELDLINGQIYLFRHEGEYTLKKYRLGDDMKPKLLYENGTGREVEMDEGEDWEVVGVFCFVG